MFRTLATDFVTSVCDGSSSNSTLGMGQSVVAASSVHEASQVQVGTFVIKHLPNHFWQSTSCEFLCPLTVSLDSSKQSTSEVLVLNDIKKMINMNDKNSANVSALKEIGVSGSLSYAYKIKADLGKVTRLDLNPEAIQNYSVPTAVAHEMKKSPGTRKVLCVVTKLFKVNKEATVKLHQDLQSSAKVSGDKERNCTSV
ncbi:uncharacterized protein LOC134844977 [Symsagittifera roscoffensis]|uniref:uncharacterized protein LOC134844977 n=1 Tax=Symsagittifera roscoffensis TaxID=84072 RepID=UPI00307BA7E0